MFDKRIKDDNDILNLMDSQYKILGVVKRMAAAKKGIYQGMASVEQDSSSEYSSRYDN